MTTSWPRQRVRYRLPECWPPGAAVRILASSSRSFPAAVAVAATVAGFCSTIARAPAAPSPPPVAGRSTGPSGVEEKRSKRISLEAKLLIRGEGVGERTDNERGEMRRARGSAPATAQSVTGAEHEDDLVYRTASALRLDFSPPRKYVTATPWFACPCLLLEHTAA